MISFQKIALKSLRRIFENNWIFEDAVTKDDRIDLLKPRDKRLLRESVLAVVRHHGEIDKYTSQFAKVTDNALRLGVAQILLLDLPKKDYVHSIMGVAEKKSDASLYNAVLNRLDQKEFKRDPKLNYPNWISGGWKKAYGDKADAIMAAMLIDPMEADYKLPEGDVVLTAPSSETGLIATKPEILHHLTQENVKEFVKIQNEMIEDAWKNLKKGQVAVYANSSLQYEEGEGLVRKLDVNKWELLEQKRVLPCDSGGYGLYWAKLKKL